MSSQSPFHKINLTLYLLIATVITGIAGYMLIEGYSFIDALYMTVITIGTVGFSEVEPLSQAGKIFTIFIILAGLGIFTFFLSQVSRYFLDGDFQRYYKHLKMIKDIHTLNNHVIICGYGRNGREAAKVLLKSKIEVVVIEVDNERALEAKEDVKFVLQSDATKDETLLHAGIEKARSVITTLPDDALNVFVVVSSKALNPQLKIISRANYNSSIRKLKNAGAQNVIMPDKIGGAHMAMLVSNPDIEEFIDIMSAQASEEFLIQEIQAQKLVSLGEADCWRKIGVNIIGIKSKSNEYILNPPPEALVHPGDGVIAMGTKTQIENAKKIFSHL